ncbi:hypothetical protein O3G_MSEX007168, partial [Manduca sexta]
MVDLMEDSLERELVNLNFECQESNCQRLKFFFANGVFLVAQTEVVSRCRDNINLLEATLASGSLSPTLQRDVR